MRPVGLINRLLALRKYMADTEYKLTKWRGGTVQAERLSSALLHIEGYSSIDPQCPLGGPDGGKDLLCVKNDWKYVAAAYFPTTDKTFKYVKEKFRGDLEGVKKNLADGIVFITNQKLTPSERSDLETLAASCNAGGILYHLERVIGILDSPAGYGTRLQFLDIGMTLEEQLSFFTQWDSSLSDKLHEQSLFIIKELSQKIAAVASPVGEIRGQVRDLSEVAKRTNSILVDLVAKSDKSNFPQPASITAVNQLTIEKICIWHKALMVDAPSSISTGELRSTEVWIGRAGATKEEADFIPPLPGDIVSQLNQLLSEWNEEYGQLKLSGKEDIVRKITRFHHGLLRIHPFTDGNGRLARFILAQQASELLKVTRKIILEDRRPYMEALSKADGGDLSKLETEITQSIYGVEFIAGSPCQMSGQNCPACKSGIMDIDPTGSGVECSTCGLSIPAIPPTES
ncbi:MAG: hypothetical protein ACI9FB_004263 [Candidatus Azotimanducaceae bacterium]|jgi:hypothetical protein